MFFKKKILLFALLFIFIFSLNFTFATEGVSETIDNKTEEEIENQEEIEKIIINGDIINENLIIQETEETETEETETEETETEETETEEVETEEVEIREGILTEEKFISKNSEEYIQIFDSIEKSVKEDALNGLEVLINNNPAVDNILLKKWGPLLKDYVGKSVTEYKTEKLVLETEEYKITLEPSKETKQWIKNDLMPFVLNIILEESKKYDAILYKVDLEEATLLSEFNADITDVKNLKVKEKIKPLNDNTEEYTLINTGQEYGVLVEQKFLNVLKGSKGGSYLYAPIENEMPSVVEKFAYITFFKNLNNLTLENKKVVDMAIYKGLGIDLITKDIIDTNNLNSVKEKKEFKDYDLKIENLMVKTLDDGVVIIQKEYLECVLWSGYEFNTNTWIDTTDFIKNNNNMVKSNKGTVNLDIYTQENGIVNTKLGNRNPFLIFANDGNEEFPFDRFIGWLYSENAQAELGAEYREQFREEVKTYMSNNGMEEELKIYLKSAGQSTLDKKIIFGGLFLIILLGIGAFFIYKKIKKKEKVEIKDSDLLFGIEEDKEN